ncbi:branched-chain amino acid ABC transporter permease [Azospirillum cavernae]|uniref:Branched-chain amino acid ABC transporter permease n=1 Tax=Azospirillum cavernae TaxID=2320860 RepID=A0A418VVZ4_9PROT|nr:branched-chain amino acid ABC transporter permease [Azospirillum cavernae]RJF81327.1 branched-chain amino acid ABC transporter permease [Azospirillum cavernae]
MDQFLQLIVAGLATGAIYALAAIGFTLVWQTSQTINFAQGEFVMLPAILVLTAAHVGLPMWLAFIVGSAAFILLFGFGFKRFLVEPMQRHGVLPLAIATMALSVLIKEAAKNGFSAEAQHFPSLVPDGSVSFLGAAVSARDIAIFVVAVAAILGLQAFITRTRTGRTMQATAQNPTVARILGVPVERMILLTFLINAALALIASYLISPVYLAKFSNGETIGLAAFIAAIVGGFNQIRGALAGGFLIGLIDNLAAAYVSSAYRAAVPLVVLVVVILVKPEGLLGRKEERTV